MAEREAKKLAKQAKKQKTPNTAASPATTIITEVEQTTITTKLTTTTTTTAKEKLELPSVVTANKENNNITQQQTNVVQANLENGNDVETAEKSRDQIKADREAKKAAKQAAKAGKASGVKVEAATQQLANLKVSDKTPAAIATAPSAPEAHEVLSTFFLIFIYFKPPLVCRKNRLLARPSVELFRRLNEQQRRKA